MKTRRVSHWQYWIIPMLHEFTWSGISFQKVYRQKTITYTDPKTKKHLLPREYYLEEYTKGKDYDIKWNKK